MKKILKRKSVSVEAQDKPSLEDLIYKMQQQLNLIEKKIDALSFQRRDNAPRFERGGQYNKYQERSFTKATCADCGSECEVPFRPSGDRPVYCKKCFSLHKGGAGSFSSFGGRKKPSFSRRRGRD